MTRSLKLAGICPSTYYYWEQHKDDSVNNDVSIASHIRQIQEEANWSYGIPRMTQELKARFGYVQLNRCLRLESAQRIRLYSTKKLPLWVEKVEIGPSFVRMKRNPFAEDAIDVIEVPFGTWDWPIRYSTPERAFIELASTIETSEEILQAKLMVEGAANLRPRQLQALLEACGNIKAKRLFLWLTRMSGHSWYQHIDTSRVTLGAGKHQIVPEGTLDSQFMITLPKEVREVQKESIF